MRLVVTALLVVLVLAGGWWVWRSRRQPAPSPPERDSLPAPDGMFLAAQGESDARAAAVLPLEGSEDARHVLGDRPTSPVEASEVGGFTPDEVVEWVIAVELPSGKEFTRRDFSRAFAADWQREAGLPTFFGLSSHDDRWTYIHAGDAPDRFLGLRIAWRYVPLDGRTPDEAEYARRLQAVAEKARVLGSATVAASQPAAAAAARSEELRDLVRDQGRDAIVVLSAASDSGFDGRDIWDVMMSLGLRWGDGDLFHWENTDSCGDDAFFSVGTSTPPGYFFPEEIAAGRVRTADLVFGFPVARTCRPLDVLEAVFRAADHARERLGGSLLTDTGAPLDPSALRSDVARCVERLEAAGFEPGSGQALFLF